MTLTRKSKKIPFVGSLIVAASLVLAGCGSSGSSGDSRSGNTSADVIAAAEKAIESGYNYTNPPTSGPKAARGKNIWIISALQQVHALAYQSDQMVKAAKDLGWTAHICDGQNNANGGWSNCVRQAVAAKADGIIMDSVDCAPVRQALVEAKQAGIKIGSFSGFDCDDPTQGGGSPLFDASAQYRASAKTMADFYTEIGKLRADVVIARSKGKAKILHVNFHGISFGEYIAKGFTSEIAKCGGCKIVSTVKFVPTDIPNMRQKFETALVKAPQADTIAVDVDYFFVAGIQQALVSAARPNLLVVGGECQLDDLNYIRSGRGEQICLGDSNGYRAYATIDAMNRVFNNEPVAPSGLGLQVVEKDNNMPPTGSEYDGPIDYRTLYRKSWGV